MKLIALQDFSWAHQHVSIKEYKEGEVIETDDQDLLDVAKAEGWVIEEGEKPSKRAKAAAPDNKDAGDAPEHK